MPVARFPSPAIVGDSQIDFDHKVAEDVCAAVVGIGVAAEAGRPGFPHPLRVANPFSLSSIRD